MYLLAEMVKEHQKALQDEAEMANKFDHREKGTKFQSRWRVKIGNLLITGGLKLKGQYQNPEKKVCFAVGDR